MTLLQHPSKKRVRAGFTLIELLVVIAIIAILVSLLLAGVFYAYTRMNDTGTMTDINQLQAAMEAFKGKYGAYPPQRIRLCSNWYQYYPAYGGTASPAAIGGPQFDSDSVSFLARIFQGIGHWGNDKTGLATGMVMDWSGTGNLMLDEILEGDQVLVFFLGGIPWAVPPAGGPPVMTANNGFAANGKNPTMPPAANVGRVSPFYNFPAGRLFLRLNPATGNASQYFPSFLDYYGQAPYLYFSAHNRKNQYNPYPNAANPNSQGNPILVTNYSGGGNALVIPYYLPGGAYATGNPQYQNPNTFQILAAGKDGNFNSNVTAAGSFPNAFQWVSSSTNPLSPPGIDDFSNFSGSRLGVSP